MIHNCKRMENSFGNPPPRVLPENTLVQFSLKLRNAFFREHASSIRVRYIRDDWRMSNGQIAYLSPDLSHYWQTLDASVTGDILSFTVRFEGEFEHWIGIYADDGETEGYEELVFYTLRSDLRSYAAFKGGIHSHSTGSDGVYEPELVPAYMRQAGSDFTAVTDHKNYAPSLRAIRALASYDSGLEVFPGEEVESYGVGINHILSLGAPASVSEWEYDAGGDFLRRTEALKSLFSALPDHEARYAAEFEAITGKIREWGGLSVFCHPYWKQSGRFASTPLLTDAILRRGAFDALEIGNYHVPRTALANAKVMEMIRETDFRKPFIGSGDWHGRPNQFAGKDYTIIFARSAAFADFADAVRAERCVAVGGYQDEFPFGSFRLVKYALFLMEHYFQKIHDPLCAEQGALLLRALAGETALKTRIAEIKRELERRRNEFFGFTKVMEKIKE